MIKDLFLINKLPNKSPPPTRHALIEEFYLKRFNSHGDPSDGR